MSICELYPFCDATVPNLEAELLLLVCHVRHLLFFASGLYFWALQGMILTFDFKNQVPFDSIALSEVSHKLQIANAARGS